MEKENKQKNDDKPQMENGTIEKREYEVTKQGKTEKFTAEGVSHKSKKTGNTFTRIYVNMGGYVKKINLEDDEAGLVLDDGVNAKYTAEICEGVNKEGVPYLGLDVVFMQGIYKRDWFTPIEKVLLTRKGFLREVK